MNKRLKLMLIIALMLCLSGYGKKGETDMVTYQQISQEEAKEIMDNGSGFIILDVREQSEYDEGHIPSAIVMPYDQASELAEELLPDKKQEILIYCRSGRRSKIAAETLTGMGYTNIKEFGGIITWPYDIVK